MLKEPISMLKRNTPGELECPARTYRVWRGRILTSVLAGLALTGCSWFVDPPSDPLVALDEHFLGCFCRNAAERTIDFICIVPGADDTSVRGTGRGLLPHLAPSDDWTFSGANERGGWEMARIVYLDIWDEAGSSGPYAAVLDEDDNSLVVRERYGTWQTDPRLPRCGE